MGSDYSSHQVYCGRAGHDAARDNIFEALKGYLLSHGHSPTQEEEADRSFVLGRVGRWLHVGDLAGSTHYADPEAFDALSRTLSQLYPVVDIVMSDDSAIYFYLYRDGALADKYDNMEFPFFAFKTEAAAQEYQGHPELWADFLADKQQVENLRAVWGHQSVFSAATDYTDDILSKTARLFGWNRTLVEVGYTHDIEGTPIKWDKYLRGRVNTNGFQESHWKYVGADKEKEDSDGQRL
jgi:hypothetical protein